MTVTLHQGDVRAVLATLPERHYHVVCTSPPYFGLRAYQTAPQVWGDADRCAHDWTSPVTVSRRGEHASTATVGNTTARVCPPTLSQGQTCLRCEAWRGEYGHEPLLDCASWATGAPLCAVCYCCHTRAICGGRERNEGLWRVLRDDGTLWWNVGDSYAGASGQHSAPQTRYASRGQGDPVGARPAARCPPGVQPLDLLMMPARVALALQADGWLLRSQICWIKSAPLPESVDGTHWERHRIRQPGPDHARWELALAEQMGRTGADRTRASADVRHQRDRQGWQVWAWADCPGCEQCRPSDGLVLCWDSGRPTSATEMIYLFAKRPHYYYDLEAVRVPALHAGQVVKASGAGAKNAGHQNPTVAAFTMHDTEVLVGRNLWNWWAVKPEPSKVAHFAGYPSQIPRTAIAAGSAPHVCPDCAAPFARMMGRRSVERWELPAEDPRFRPERYDEGKGAAQYGAGHNGQRYLSTTMLAWRPTCRCPGVTVENAARARVLDPFCGSGTTLLAAEQMGRDATGIDLQPEYIALTERRLRESAPLFADVRVVSPAPTSDVGAGEEDE